jgi:signal transduction histidine kinase/ActR/RegA family two-component response regulator
MRKILSISSLLAALAALAYLLHRHFQTASVIELFREQPSIALVPAIASLLIAYVWLMSIRYSVSRTARSLKKEIEEEKRLRGIAEAGNLARGEFLAHMSHEIRTPMNGILGFTELALKSEISAELRGYLDTVRTSAKWLMHVINDILDFSCLEAGTLDLRKESFSLEECIRPAIQMVQAQADEKKLPVKYTVDRRIPSRLVGDRTRLEQVIVNLLDNAVKFTSTGSVLVSAALESESGQVVVLLISVADTGMGIPPDRQRFLFEPFVRSGDSFANSRDPGVGLAICRKLVELMEGAMDVQSQIGAGSRFSFRVKLEKSSEPNATPERAAPALENNPLSLLVAEDNVVSRHLLTRVLESAGHSVTQASTGEEAVRLFQAGSFDALLMDVAMPEMDGLEAVRRIRSCESAGHRVPIYATTAHTMPGDRQSCLDAGMDGYISKPLDVDDLLKLIAGIGSAKDTAHSSGVPSESAIAL